MEDKKLRRWEGGTLMRQLIAQAKKGLIKIIG
jgi:hypothetical protein